MKYMKNLSILFTIIFYCAQISAQNNFSIINGEWAGNSQLSKIGLYSIKNGIMNHLVTSPIKDGHFNFTTQLPYEGYYAIAPNSYGQGKYRYLFYLKPGDNLNFKIEGETYRLIGKENTDENKYMEQWHELMQPLEKMSIYFTPQDTSCTYKYFFPLLEKTIPQINKLPKAQTKNILFNNSFEEYKKFNLLNIATVLTLTPRMIQPNVDDYIDFYQTINLPELTKTTAILNYPNGIDLIKEAYIVSVSADANIPRDKIGDHVKNAFDYILLKQLISNDTIKGEIALKNLERITMRQGLGKYEQKYRKYIITSEQKNRFSKIIEQFEDNISGEKAINFKFKDLNGKQISLSDYIGKVVYIDVWATWCGPCNKEIPYLTELEESYRENSNIIFISISIDAPKDYNIWKKTIEKKGMKGIQLFAGEQKNDIMKPYKITNIPYFILIGKDGKVIKADAPRPSSPDIKSILNNALK